MDFRKPKDSPFLVGTTQKKNTISFVPVSEEKLVVLNKQQVEAIREFGTKEFIDQPEPTRLVLYCSFLVTAQMADELEQSKILYVDEICNNRTQIIVYPLAFFDYQNLQDILFDLTQKFDL